MTAFTLDMFQTTGLAMLLFVLGRFLITRVDFLRRCCIPAPVVGSLIFAIVHLALYQGGILQLSFDESVKNFFMTLFFTSVGYTACFRLLKRGGKKVFVFLLISIIMVCMQNVLSSVLAAVFNWDMRMGLCTGSIPMVGGHGTAGSYGPLMERMGLAGAEVLAIAAATFGLVAGSLMGGPTARGIIKKYNLTSNESQDEILEMSDETPEQKEAAERVDVNSFTNAAILLIVAAGLGTILTSVFNGITIMGAKLTFPTYIGSMVIAAVIRNFCDAKHIVLPSRSIDIWGNVSLSIFLAVALMTLKLWQLADLAGPMIIMLAAQTLLMFFFARYVVFNLMGRDYEAAVMTSAFCGFGMGATPNAMANMQVLTAHYGPAPQAYFIVPLVGSLFIDFFNGIIITAFLNVLPYVQSVLPF